MQPVHKADIDTNNTDPEYWERVLRSYNLGMDRGSRRHSTSYVGDVGTLDAIEQKRLDEQEMGGRRVVPNGAGPDV